VTQSSSPEVLGPRSFRGRLLQRPGTWIVDFSADWCPFCRAFRALFDAVPADPAYHLAIGDLTSEENPLWETMGVEIVPTLVVFRDGKAIFRVDGVGGAGLTSEDLDRAVAAARSPDSPLVR
jgi:thioredoxin-like negative regulator of GroEL